MNLTSMLFRGMLAVFGMMSVPGHAEVKNDLPSIPAGQTIFKDPIFNQATDPVLTYDAANRRWLMYYTQRRGRSIEMIHGTKIGVAASTDSGGSWTYLGTADITYGQDRHPNDYTYWAPEVIQVGNTFHMWLSFVPGIFTDWRHPREIVHLTSADGLKWESRGKVDLKSEKVIDACVIQLPGERWRMFYKDEARKNTLAYADSDDLEKWDVKGNAVTDRNGEGAKCIRWAGKYWLIADTWRGQGVWSSDDCTTWKPQDGVLVGNHGDVVINGDRAWWFYFGGEKLDPKFKWALAPATAGDNADAVATSRPAGPSHGLDIRMTELKVVDGKLMFLAPGTLMQVDLGDKREPEK